jgi:hypothetical protein
VRLHVLAAAAALLVSSLTVADTQALILTLGPADMTRALELARWPTSEAERVRFHGRYDIPVKSPIIDSAVVERIEVVTEFRRLELIAEEHARINDLFGRAGLAEVEAALRPYRGRLSLVVHLAFQATRLGLGNVPELEILREGLTPIWPIDVRQTPVYAYCPESSGCNLTGARVEAVFEAAAIGQCRCSVGVRSDGNELARVAVDFSRMD